MPGWDTVAQLVQQRADQLAQRLRATVPDLRIKVRHDNIQSAILYGSWVELNRETAPRDEDDLLVELLFMRDTGHASVTVYDRDQSTLVDEEFPFPPAAGVEQALAVARQALDVVDDHAADIEERLLASA